MMEMLSDVHRSPDRFPAKATHTQHQTKKVIQHRRNQQVAAFHQPAEVHSNIIFKY